MEDRSKLGIIARLFLVFAEIGAVTFGGGYAMLPILQREVVEKRGWATEEELMDYYAIGQCTPGIIAINVATFIGYKQAGVLGGLFATFGVVSPSIVIITIISLFLETFAELAIVRHAFSGIRAAVTVLILDSVLKLGKKSVKDLPCAVIFAAVWLATTFTRLSPVVSVVLSGAVAWVLSFLSARKKVA